MDMMGPVLLQDPVDGPCYDISCGQRPEGVLMEHERQHVRIRPRRCLTPLKQSMIIEEDGSEATQRFGDEEGAVAGDGECSGVELHELHVTNGRSRTYGHRDPVARRNRWIRGLSVQLASTAAGKDHDISIDGLDGTGIAVQRPYAPDAIVGRTMHAG